MGCITEEYRQKYPDFKKFVGETEYILRLYQDIVPCFNSDATVLIIGEIGCGKELVAKAIHHSGKRSSHNFVQLNCQAITASLADSELFGYDKGAFTGALTKGKIGYFEEAHNGTLFLDEIDKLPLEVQGKLLRVLQEKEIMKVGATKPIRVDVRIICATNSNLHELVERGRFLPDLLDRIQVFQISVPSLTNRVCDIPLLVKYFAERENYKILPNLAIKISSVFMMSPDNIDSILSEQKFSSTQARLSNLKYGTKSIRRLEKLMEKFIIYAKMDDEKDIKIIDENSFSIERYGLNDLTFIKNINIDKSHTFFSAFKDYFKLRVHYFDSSKHPIPTGDCCDLEDGNNEKAYWIELLTKHHGNVKAIERELNKPWSTIRLDIKNQNLDPRDFKNPPYFAKSQKSQN